MQENEREHCPWKPSWKSQVDFFENSSTIAALFLNFNVLNPPNLTGSPYTLVHLHRICGHFPASPFFCIAIQRSQSEVVVQHHNFQAQNHFSFNTVLNLYIFFFSSLFKTVCSRFCKNLKFKYTKSYYVEFENNIQKVLSFLFLTYFSPIILRAYFNLSICFLMHHFPLDCLFGQTMEEFESSVSVLEKQMFYFLKGIN